MTILKLSFVAVLNANLLAGGFELEFKGMADGLLPQERIESRIFVFRARKVMIDRDLALLYGVSTKAFKQAVRRNKARFPEDFMFQLNTGEFNIWRSQFVTSKSDRMGLRHRPFVFTEQGVAMLSSILKSKRAIQVNIQIMRTFSKLREMLVENDDLRRKIEAIERHYDEQFKVVFDAIRSLFDQKAVDPQTIGFHEK